MLSCCVSPFFLLNLPNIPVLKNQEWQTLTRIENDNSREGETALIITAQHQKPIPMEEHTLLRQLMEENSSHFAPLPPLINPYQPNPILIPPMNFITMNLILRRPKVFITLLKVVCGPLVDGGQGMIPTHPARRSTTSRTEKGGGVA